MFHSWPCSIIYECSCFIPGLVVSSLSIYVSFLALLTAIWNNIFIQLLKHKTNWFGCNVYIRKRDKLQKWIWCSNRLALKHKCVDTFTYYTYICIEAVLYTTSNVWTQSDTLHQLYGYSLKHFINCMDTVLYTTSNVWIQSDTLHQLYGYSLKHSINCIDTVWYTSSTV